MKNRPRFPVRREDVVLLDRGEQSVMLVGDRESVVAQLNPTAHAIWELCDGRTRPEEMVDAICQLFSIPAARASVDVDRALDELAEAVLIRWESAPVPETER